MRTRLPIIIAEPVFSRDPLTNEELAPTYTNYRAYADRVDRTGNERLFGDIEAGEWSSVFTVRWPSRTQRVNENWLVYDEFGILHEIKSVTQSRDDWSSINIFASRYSTELGEEAPVTPTQPTVILLVGWSADSTAQAAELTAGSTTSSIVIPEATGNQHLILWRADIAGGNPTSVEIGSARSWRNVFGPAMPLIHDEVPGQAIITVYNQDAGLLSGETVSVR